MGASAGTAAKRNNSSSKSQDLDSCPDGPKFNLSGKATYRGVELFPLW